MKQPQKPELKRRLTSLRPGLHILLTIVQGAGLVGMIVCLFATGFSIWTLLVGLGAAVATKFNLVMMDNSPDFGDDTEALTELAEFVVKGPSRRG